jgi:hypothetical protein
VLLRIQVHPWGFTYELDADPASAIGSNGFSLGNFDITITPGDFKIDPYPGLPAMVQDVYFEQWLTDNADLDLEDPFSSSYAISQSLGMRLITLLILGSRSPDKRNEWFFVRSIRCRSIYKVLILLRSLSKMLKGQIRIELASIQPFFHPYT